MRLLIVDDHTLFREGLSAIIRTEPDIDIVGLAGSVQEAVALAREKKPEIILMDFQLPDGSGADATRAILSENPNCKIVFLSIYQDKEHLLTAVRAGAKGYLLKDMRPAKLINALRGVLHGESALSRSMTLEIMEELTHTIPFDANSASTLAQLTHREQDVLNELAHDFNNEEIAQRLFLSENTVRYHIHSILEKLHLADRKEAGMFARQHGLLR